VRVVGRGAGVATSLACAVALAACSTPRSPTLASLPDTLKWHGAYLSDTLLSAGSPEKRVARFAVGPDTQAILAIEFVQRGTVFRRGVWWAAGSVLTFEPRRGDGTPSEKLFVWRLEGRRLVPAQWDHELYGAGGIPLTRMPPAAPASPADTTAGVKP
jgi:hypothetical protein